MSASTHVPAVPTSRPRVGDDYDCSICSHWDSDDDGPKCKKANIRIMEDNGHCGCIYTNTQVSIDAIARRAHVAELPPEPVRQKAVDDSEISCMDCRSYGHSRDELHIGASICKRDGTLLENLNLVCMQFDYVEETGSRKAKPAIKPLTDKPANKRDYTDIDDEHALRIHDVAMRILTEGSPLDYLAGVVGTLHKGDVDAVKLLFLSEINQSVENTKGFQPGMHGGSGKGKSDATKKVKWCSPQEMFVESSVSGKALYYMANSGRLQEGTTVLCDDMNLKDDTRECLKRCSTNFTEETKHNTVVNGKHVELRIPPRIVWWLTSVDSDQDDQILNREIPLSVDESETTDKAVFEQQCEELRTGQIALPINDDILTCREIIKTVKNKTRNVLWDDATPGRIDWQDMNNRRNFAVFSDVFKSVALLNRYKTGQGEVDVVHATEADFIEAAAVYCKQGESQVTKLSRTRT